MNFQTLIFFPRPPYGRPREKAQCFSGGGAPKKVSFFSIFHSFCWKILISSFLFPSFPIQIWVFSLEIFDFQKRFQVFSSKKGGFCWKFLFFFQKFQVFSSKKGGFCWKLLFLKQFPCFFIQERVFLLEKWLYF